MAKAFALRGQPDAICAEPYPTHFLSNLSCLACMHVHTSLHLLDIAQYVPTTKEAEENVFNL